MKKILLLTVLILLSARGLAHGLTIDYGGNIFYIHEGIKSDTVASTGAGKIRWNPGESKWQYSNDGLSFFDIGTSSGASKYTDLADVDTITGHGGEWLKIKAGEDGIEYGTPAGSGDMTKAVYDVEDDGKVDTANYADDADKLDGQHASAFAPATSGTDILKGDGAGGFAAASAGTDYQAPLTNPVTGTGTSGKLSKWQPNGTAGDSTDDDTGIHEAVTLKHSANADTALLVTAEPSVDHQASGTWIDLTASDTVAFGDVCRIDSNGKAALAKADAIANASGICMAVVSINANATGRFLLLGVARDDTWNWTPGGLIYLSTTGTTANTLTQSAPSGSNNVIQLLGVATHADRMLFKPELVQVEHN